MDVYSGSPSFLSPQQYDLPDPVYVDHDVSPSFSPSNPQHDFSFQSQQPRLTSDRSKESYSSSVKPSYAGSGNDLDDSLSESTASSSRGRPALPPKPKPATTAKFNGVGAKSSNGGSASYDKSLSPEERMRLYRQQLQFNWFLITSIVSNSRQLCKIIMLLFHFL